MKYVAPIAANLGVSVEETSAAVAKLSDAGIQGEMAGTQLRAIMLRLANPTKEVAYVMKQLGVSVTDAAGNFLPFNQIIGQFEQGFGKLTEAQRAQAASILAGQEAASGFLTLIKAGQADLESFTEELNNSGGTAERIAEVQMDTLNGAIQEMQSAMEAVGITVGDKFAPAIRKGAEEVSRMLLGFNELSPGMQTAIIAFTTVTPLIAGAVVAIRTLTVALATLQVSVPVLAAVSLAIGALVGGFALYSSNANAAEESARKFADAQRTLNEQLSESPLRRSVEEVQEMQTAVEELTKALEYRASIEERIKEIQASGGEGELLGGVVSELDVFTETLTKADEKLRELGYGSVPDAEAAIENMNEAIKESTPALLAMREAEIQDLIAKKEKTQATEQMVARYRELAESQNLDAAQKQELSNLTAALRKEYPDLIAQIDSEGNARLTNIGIIDDHISAERSYVDEAIRLMNVQIDGMAKVAEANRKSIAAQITNYQALLRTMSAVAGAASGMKQQVTAIGGMSVNPTIEGHIESNADKYVTDIQKQLGGLSKDLYDASQHEKELAQLKQGLTDGSALTRASGAGVGSGINLVEDKTKKAKDKKAKSPKAKKEKSAAEIAKEMRDKAYNADLATIRYQADMYDWSADQQIKAYEKLRKAHAQHLKETVEDARTLNLQLKRLQEDSVKSRYDFSMTWIDKEERRMEDSGKSEVSIAEMKIAALTRVRDRYKKDSDQYKDADEALYKARKELVKANEKAVADAYSASEKWIGKEERRMETAGKSELEITQMKIDAWTRVRDRHAKDSEYYEKAEDQLYNLRKKLVTETQKLADQLLKTEKTNIDAALKADLAAIDERKKAYIAEVDEKIAAIDRLLAKEQELNVDADWETQRSEKLARIDLLSSAVGPEGIQEREDLIKEVARMELEHDRELRKRELESQKSALQDEKDTRTSAFDAEKTETQRQYDNLKDAFENHADDVKFIESAISEFRTNANAEANATILSSLDSFVTQYNAKMSTLSTGVPTAGSNVDLTEYNANKDAWAAAKASGDTAEMARLTARNEELRKLYGIDKDTGKLQQFKVGGVVQGAPGSAVPVIAHAGEMILNDAQIGNLFRMIAAGPSDTGAAPTQVINQFDMSVNDVTLTDRADTETLYDERARAVQRLQTQGVKTR